MKHSVTFCGLLLLFTVLLFQVDQKPVNNNHKEKNPEEPYEEFMLQRIFPNTNFDTKAYKEALMSAQINSSASRMQTNASWQLEGPGNIGGRFNCLAVNPVNTDIMYAGSANGGIWKTTDNGVSWIPVFDDIPFLAIGAIAINPNNVNEIWVGTGDPNIGGTVYLGNGLYKSSDAGTTWNYVALDNCFIISSILFNPANSLEMIVGAMGNPFNKDNNRGIYRTTNGGSTFTQMHFVNDSTGIIDMIQDPLNPSTIYASSFTRYRTFGRSVTLGTEVYVYKSTDFGQTWNTLAGGLPNGQLHERLGLGLCNSNPNVVYALYSSSDTIPDLYKSTNGGTTWSQVNFSQFDQGSYGTFGWYFGKIYVDPNDENTVYIPGVELQYSTDGGVTWDPRQPPWWMYEVHADGHHMHFNSSSEFIFCTDGGIYRTQDWGNTWEDIENIPNNQFYSITENILNPGEYAGGVQDNGTLRGNASTFNSYERIFGGDGFTVTYTTNPVLLYSESQYGNIVYDDDYPNGNWNGLDMDFSQNYNWHTPYILSHFGEDTVYLGGQSIMRIDGAPYGFHTVISPVLHDSLSPERVSNISTIDQSPLAGEYLYAGTADGRVWNTLDRGNNWKNITPFQSSHYYVTSVKASPNFASNVYVTRSGYRLNDNTPLVFKSTDNGQNWTGISGDLPMLAVNDIEIYNGDENIIFIANDAGVYFTQNGGVNWERVGNNLPYVAVLDIDLNFNQSRLIAGTFGRSMYTIDVSIVLGTKEITTKESIKVYPNPAVDNIFIATDRRIDDVEVYSVSGKLIRKYREKTFDVSLFQPGKYLLKMRDGSEIITSSFIKL